MRTWILLNRSIGQTYWKITNNDVVARSYTFSYERADPDPVLATQVLTLEALMVGDGGPASPGISFTTHPTYGIYLGAGGIGISINGVPALLIGPGGLITAAGGASFGGGLIANGDVEGSAFNSDSTLTNVAGSSFGNCFFGQPFRGGSFRQVIIYLNSLRQLTISCHCL